ncbi:uncharacterized protein LOC130284811 isoform X1 [Hyla sarda]|uniref:uncharacterized protein LOC130284811 isoform X1 n=1 Tax=Hyla sarda TaxID=327740 RepID=UPI0024C44653|nr:uncharacterized protein LOC130284811 isoform X1 [Hyla sarda]
MIRAVPYGQYLRARRICSTESTFHQQADDLRQRFKDRGYSNRNIKKAYNRAKVQQRSQLLRPKQPLPTNEQVRFVTKFNVQWHQMYQCMEKFWPILTVDPILKQYVTDRPAITARRVQNLKDMLVKSEYIPIPSHPFGIVNQRLGCVPCGRYVACPNIERTSVFTDSSGSRQFSIRHFITCSTKGETDYVTVLCFLLMRVFMNMESYSSDP